MKPSALLIIATVLIASPQFNASVAQSSDPGRLFERAELRLADRRQDLIELRHDIHRHPELSDAEERTAGLVRERLVDLGFEVRTGFGGHGVVGVLKGGRPGPVVAFRADMDAVRSSDPDPVSYRSLTPGVRHICGHDVHTAIGVAIAEAFAAIKNDFAGSVMLIFQPAEERGTGAKAMLRDGAWDGITPDAVFAVHTAPYNVGEVGTIGGAMMAGRASISVTVKARENLDEAIAAVRAAIENEGTLSPRQAGQNAPTGFILVQLFGRAGAAASGNSAVVQGQVMTAGPRDRARAKANITGALAALKIPGVTVATDYDEHFMEGVTNDSALVDLANEGIRSLAPDITIRTIGGIVPAFSEDFGSFQALAPGAMYFLGVSNPEKGTVGMPHSPNYVADDDAILVGARAMLAAMLSRMTAE